MNNTYLGKDVKRYDGLDHITGATKYVDDITVPHTLMVKVLRSPVAKGELIRINTTAAEQLPGVAAVITHVDVPHPLDDDPILAKSIRYKGQPIAAVAAIDERTAIKALGLIDMLIEEQTPVFDPIKAMRADSPKVRPEGNVFRFEKRDCRRVVFGDVKKGFKEADVILEENYLHPPIEHAPMEPNTCLVVPEANGRLNVYTMSQGAHVTLQALFRILQAEPNSPICEKWAPRHRNRGITHLNDINCASGFCGGAFGGKAELHAEPITAILALITGQPVKWRWTREEDLLYSVYRGSWHIRIKDGIMKDGRIVAREIRSIREAGAYAGQNPYATEKHSFLAAGPYFIPNVLIEGYCVFTNKPKAGGMRGFGITPSTFATEVQMDRIAHTLGIDPWRLRFINAYRDGEMTPTRRIVDSVYLIETLQALARKAGITLSEDLMEMRSILPRETEGMKQ